MIGESFIISAQKGIQWALSRLSKEGNFYGSETMLLGHYKAPQTFATAGFVQEAEKIIVFLRSFFPGGGDFNCLPGDPSPPTSANYRNAWICWGAQTLGAYDLSVSGGEYLESSQNKNNGGLPPRCENQQSDQIIDWGSTSSGIIAFLALGKKEPAVRAGECLGKMIDQQPEPEDHFYLCKRWSGEWITQFQRGEATRFVVEFGKPNQIYWYFGIGMSALGKLFLATGDTRWLEFAIRIFDLANKCSPDVYQTLTSAKIGWGASVLYRITGENRFKDVTLQVANFLMDTQTSEGIWIRKPQFNSINDQPIPQSLDTTLERCLWLYEMARGIDNIC